MSLTVRIRGDASQFEKTMRGVKSSIGGLSTAIGGAGAATAVAGLAAGFVAVGKAAQFLQSSSEKAAGIESLTMQFETLLGSATAAKKRMAEIAKFAASTPFEIAELSATSKLLQTMGGNLLATGEGLRMVGDAAAITGQPLGQIGLHIGRVFNAITSGTSAGESVGRLQELGLITGTVKREFEDLANAQKKGKAPILDQAQALTILKKVLSDTDGAMARLSTTTEGKLSNMKDNVDQLQVAFGTGFNNGLRDALDAANTFLPQLEGKFKIAGELVGNALTDALSGDMRKFKVIGEFIGAVLAQGVASGFDKFVMGTIEKVLVDYADFFANESRARSSSAANQIMDKALAENDPETRKRLGEIGMRIAQKNLGESSVSEKYQLGAEYQKIGAPSLADRVRPELNALQLEMAISNAMSKSIDMSMPQAVREGILEAQRREMVNQAKFSN